MRQLVGAQERTVILARRISTSDAWTSQNALHKSKAIGSPYDGDFIEVRQFWQKETTHR